MLELEICTLGEALEGIKGDEQFLHELTDKFRQWLKQQVHLPQDISDQRLHYAIRMFKFDLDKAKDRLEKCYIFGNIIPEVYTNLDPLSDSMIQVPKTFQCIILPKLTPEKYRVNIYRFVHSDSSAIETWDIIKYVYMIEVIRIEEDRNKYEILILDFTNAFGYVLKFTPSVIKKIVFCMETYGLRVKEIYFINVPNIVEHIITFIKSIVSPKISSRIHVYTSGIESLYGIIPKSILPIDYGGEQPSLDALADAWHAKLIDWRDWLLEHEKNVIRVSRESNIVINKNDLFGVPGTFRKLEID